MHIVLAGISQEVESLLNQLRASRLSIDSWDSACMLLSQLEASIAYCAACQASITWTCLEKQGTRLQVEVQPDQQSRASEHNQ